MEAIVLAGGLGTRLRQIIPDRPKALAPLGGKPFLAILLSHLATKGFNRAVLSLGYMAGEITKLFGDSFAGMDLAFVVEESPLGTGGAIRTAIEHCLTDHVFIFNGDTYLDLEAVAVEKQWRSRRRPIIVASKVADTSRYGRLTIEDNQVTGFVEKGAPGPGFINAGCYVLSTKQLDAFSVKQSFSMEKDYLYPTAQVQPFDLFISNGQFIDIGIPKDYLLAQAMLAGKHI